MILNSMAKKRLNTVLKMYKAGQQGRSLRYSFYLLLLS